jgi:hypothetical protein
MNYESDEGTNVHGDRRQQITTTSKFQSLSIFIISFCTTTPLAINCSSIIYHSTSIPVEGEYRLPLKGCLNTSGSSLQAPISTSNITLSAIAFTDPRSRPLTLVEHGACRALVFCGVVTPSFLFLVGVAGARGGASVLIEMIRPATDCRALAFEENQIIHVNRCNKININIMKDIHRKIHFISRNM